MKTNANTVALSKLKRKSRLYNFLHLTVLAFIIYHLNGIDCLIAVLAMFTTSHIYFTLGMDAEEESVRKVWGGSVGDVAIDHYCRGVDKMREVWNLPIPPTSEWCPPPPDTLQ